MVAFLITVVVLAIFSGALFLYMKKGNEKFEKMFAKVGIQDRELLKNADYQSYDAEPDAFVAMGIVTDLENKKGDMIEVLFIYYNQPRMCFLGEAIKVKEAVIKERQLRAGSHVQVVFKVKDGIPAAKELL